MEEVYPRCARCEARAETSFATYTLAVSGIVVVYCTKCGAVQGVAK